MPYTTTSAFKINHRLHAVFKFTVKVPQILLVDPRGHFLHWRMAAVRTFDKLGVKLKFGLHLIANMCEFLANYPTI